MEKILIKIGYKKDANGWWYLITKQHKHWVTPLNEGRDFQAYGYYLQDESFQRVYDTGYISRIEPNEMKVTLTVLIRNND